MAVAPAARQGCATHNDTCQARCFTSWLLRRPCSTARRDLLACASKRGRRAEPQQVQEVDTTCLSATEKLISLAQRPNVPVGSAAAVEALTVLEAHLPSHLPHLPLPRLCSTLWALARLQLTPSQSLQDCIANHLLTAPPPEAVHAAAAAAAAEQRRRGGWEGGQGDSRHHHQQQQQQKEQQQQQKEQQQQQQWAGSGQQQQGEQEQQQLLEERRGSNYEASSSSSSQEDVPSSSSSRSQPTAPPPPTSWLVLADRYSLGAVVYAFNAFGYRRLVFWGALAAVLTGQLTLTKSNILGNMLKSVSEVYYSSRAPAESASDPDSTQAQARGDSEEVLSQLEVTQEAAGEAAAALDGFSLALTRWLLRCPELLLRWRLRDVAALVGCLAVSAAGRPETQQLLMVLAQQLLLDPTGRRLAAARPGDAATIAWAYVHCGVPHVQLLGALARHIAASAPDLRAPDLGKLLWAYATVNVVDRSMLTELGVWVSEAVHEVHPRVAAAVVWACGKMKQPVPALVEASLDRLTECLEQGLPPNRVDIMGSNTPVGVQPPTPPAAAAAAAVAVVAAGPAAAGAGSEGGAAAPTALQAGGAPQAAVEVEASKPAAATAAAAGGLSDPGPSLLQQLLAQAREAEAGEGSAAAAAGSSGRGDSSSSRDGGQQLTICPPVAPVEPVVNPAGLTFVNQVSLVTTPGSSSSSSSSRDGSNDSSGALCTPADTAQRQISSVSQSQRPTLTWGGQPGDVAHALWGAGRLGHDNRAFLVAATAAVPLLVFDWSNAQLVGALWGYARLRWYPGQTAMQALEQQLLARASELTARQLVMVNWSCAVLRHRSTPLLTALTGRILDLIQQQQAAAAAAGRQGTLMHSWQQQPFDYTVDPAVDFDWSMPEDEAQELAVMGVDTPAAAPTPIAEPPSSSSSMGPVNSGQQRVNIAVRQDAMAPVSAVLLAWSAAYLHHRDSQLFQGLASILLPSLPRLGAPALCQVLWAFATAGQLDERLWSTCYKRLTELTATKAARLSSTSLMQLFQADLFLQDSFPGAARPPARLPRPLATAAEQQWLATARRGAPRQHQLSVATTNISATSTTSSSSRREVVTFMGDSSTSSSSSSSSGGASRGWAGSERGVVSGVSKAGATSTAAAAAGGGGGSLQAHAATVSSNSGGGGGTLLSQEVLTVLRLLGLTPQVEALTRDGLFSLDMVVTWQDRRVAVEVDGPLHFSSNRPYTPLGPTLSRRRSLAARGYYVCPVPFYEWRQLGRLVPLAQRVARHGQMRAAKQREQQQKGLQALLRRGGAQQQQRRLRGRRATHSSTGSEEGDMREEEVAEVEAMQGAGDGVLRGVTPDQAQQHMEYLRAALDRAVHTPITAWLE